MPSDLIPVVAALIATVTTLIVDVLIKSRWEFNKEKREFVYRQLSEFYDPIFALLSVNKDVFAKLGPRSLLPNESTYKVEERKRVWDKVVDGILLPNNQRVCDFINMKSYLMAQGDSMAIYSEFTTHASAYSIFRGESFEGYEAFGFPKEFLEHVASFREQLRHKIPQ